MRSSASSPAFSTLVSTSHVQIVGTIAQKAEEYGNHDKRLEIASEGTVIVSDNSGNKIFENAVETGDFGTMCQIRDIPIQSWVRQDNGNVGR